MKKNKKVEFLIDAKNTVIPDPGFGHNAEREDTEGYRLATKLGTTALIDIKPDNRVNILQIVPQAVVSKFLKTYEKQLKKFPKDSFCVHLSPELTFMITPKQLFSRETVKVTGKKTKHVKKSKKK